jgi:hypothetical protein
MRLATLTLLLLAGPAAAADPCPKSRAKAALALASSCDCPKEAAPKCGRAAEVLLAVIAQIDAESKGLPTAPPPRAKCEGCGGKCETCGPGCSCPRPAAPVAPEARKVPAPMPAAPVVSRFVDVNGCTWEARTQPGGSVVYVRVSCPQRR